MSESLEPSSIVEVKSRVGVEWKVNGHRVGRRVPWAGGALQFADTADSADIAIDLKRSAQGGGGL